MIRLLSRLVEGKTSMPPVPITVYSRKDCDCCAKAIGVLEGFRRRFPLSIIVVDVDGDPMLADVHGLSVPVVEVDGEVRFRGVVNPVLLERLLRARGRGA